jgi:hypothetical protein
MNVGTLTSTLDRRQNSGNHLKPSGSGGKHKHSRLVPRLLDDSDGVDTRHLDADAEGYGLEKTHVIPLQTASCGPESAFSKALKRINSSWQTSADVSSAQEGLLEALSRVPIHR